MATKKSKNMRFVLKIDGGNDAMRTAADVAAVLTDAAHVVRNANVHDASGNIIDRNGNTVGNWEFANLGGD